jgi:membrane protease YdiL (CAAX protease family)
MTHHKFSLVSHPWLFLLVFMAAIVVCQLVAGTILMGAFNLPSNAPITGFWASLLSHLLLLFIVVPFGLGFPTRSNPYATYLSEIRLTQVQPLLRLILLGMTCSVIFILLQASGTLIFRLSQGLDIDPVFIKYSFPLSAEFQPGYPGWLFALPSIFEEVQFRGVILALFLRYYTRPKAILFSALGFGAIHSLNILTGRDPVWVAGQVMWAAILGLFYGYVTLKTNSLLPAMLVHYLSNLTIYPMTAYLQNNASIPVQVLFGVTLTFGIVPVILMSLWVRFFTTKIIQISSTKA